MKEVKPPFTLDEKRGTIQLKSTRDLTLNFIIPVHRIIRFWEGLKEGKLLATKCKRCHKISFPPKMDCPDCLASAEDMDWVELSEEAELLSFTEISIKPGSFSQYPDYICAVGRLREGVKVLAWLTGIKREEIKVGMRLKLKPKITEERLTYEFIPAE